MLNSHLGEKFQVLPLRDNRQIGRNFKISLGASGHLESLVDKIQWTELRLVKDEKVTNLPRALNWCFLTTFYTGNIFLNLSKSCILHNNKKEEFARTKLSPV